MISLLIWLIVVCFLIGIAVMIVRAFPIPAPFGNLLIALVCLVALLLFVDQVGLLHGALTLR